MAGNENSGRTNATRRSTALSENSERRFSVKEVTDKHHDAIRMMVLGFSDVEISKRLGLVPAQVTHIRRSPLVRERIKVLAAARDKQTVDLAAELQLDAIQSFRFLQAVRDGSAKDENGDPIIASINLRSGIAFGLMDRAGFSPVKRIQGEVLHAHLSNDQIQALKQRAADARALAAGSNDVVEADYEECSK